MSRFRFMFITTMMLFVVTAPNASAHHAGLSTHLGPSSWYGGACDKQDNNRSYTGLPHSEPGIALYYLRPFKAYYLLTGPTGRKSVVRHSDKGPAPWTGKLVDLNWTAARAVGFRATSAQCILGYPTGRVVRITRLYHSDRVRYWSRRTVTKLDNRWSNLKRIRTW